MNGYARTLVEGQSRCIMTVTRLAYSRDVIKDDALERHNVPQRNAWV